MKDSEYLRIMNQEVLNTHYITNITERCVYIDTNIYIYTVDVTCIYYDLGRVVALIPSFRRTCQAIWAVEMRNAPGHHHTVLKHTPCWNAWCNCTNLQIRHWKQVANSEHDREVWRSRVERESPPWKHISYITPLAACISRKFFLLACSCLYYKDLQGTSFASDNQAWQRNHHKIMCIYIIIYINIYSKLRFMDISGRISIWRSTPNFSALKGANMLPKHTTKPCIKATGNTAVRIW